MKGNKVTLKKMFAAEDDENKQCTVSLEEAESVILDGLKALRQGRASRLTDCTGLFAGKNS